MFETPRILAPIGTSDHATVLVESKVHAPKMKATRKVNVKPLKESSLQAFDDYLKQIDWSLVFLEDHVDSMVNVFLELTCNMIDTFFPTKTVKVHDEDKPFLTGKIKKLIDKRNKAFKSGNLTLFKTLRNSLSKIRPAKSCPTYSQNPNVWWTLTLTLTFINLYRANSTNCFQMRVTTMDRTIKILRTNVTILIKD